MGRTTKKTRKRATVTKRPPGKRRPDRGEGSRTKERSVLLELHVATDVGFEFLRRAAYYDVTVAGEKVRVVSVRASTE